ncbi:MAG: amine dehydrogenase large subunit [Pseudohongiellaceae bacterium]
MRGACLTAVLAVCWLSTTSAQLQQEVFTVETLPEPGPNWFIAKTNNGGYIFDAESGEMQGLLSLSRRTPAVTLSRDRGEFYAPESYMSRGVRGVRTDVVTVYDFENLSPIAEVEIPNHMARLSVRNHVGLLNNERHLAVLNMNPGHSVSIVDVIDRVFVYEISTPGCAVILPVAENDFLMVCGDGTLQLIQLDISGFEVNRARSEVFFDVQEDAVFDRTARTADGWLLITHSGTVFEVSVSGEQINIGEPWSIVPEGEEDWRPGGDEFLSVHQETGLLYVAMHQGPVDTHHEPGQEIWLVSVESRRRILRKAMDSPVTSLMVTQETAPRLIAASEEGTEVYDAFTLAHERTIVAPSAALFEDF